MRLQSRDAFSSYHPAVNFLYFGLVLFFTMCFLHPACLLLSLAAALRYAVCLNGRRAVRRSLRYLLPAALLARAKLFHLRGGVNPPRRKVLPPAKRLCAGLPADPSPPQEGPDV